MNKSIKNIQHQISNRPYLFLILFGVLSRAFIAIAYSGQVSEFNDTGSYLPLAERLSTFDLKGYDGIRTPGYPFLLMIANLNFHLVVIIQSILGIVTSLFIYDTSIRILKSIRIALFNGISASFFLHLLFYERAILTETLTLFTLTWCLWYLVKIDFFKKHKRISPSSWQLCFVGLLTTIVFLVRPMFIVIPPLITFFYLVIYKDQKLIKLITKAFIICLPATLSYQAWSSLNAYNTGYKSVTAFSGVNLAQNCVSFIEHASDEYAPLRNLYVHKRDSIIAHKGDISMSIWAVYGELQQKEGITVYELSERLDPMNKELIKNHPWPYIKQVSISWRDFWKDELLWNYKKFKNKPSKWILSGTWLFIQRPLLFILTISFLAISILMTYHRIKKRRFLFDFEFFCVALIIGSSLGQALVIYGNNARFSVPFTPFILLVVTHYVYKKWYFKKSFSVQ